PVADRPVRLAPGALLRIGESALRLASPRAETALDTQADGEGHIRVGVPAIAVVDLSADAPGGPAGATVSGFGDAGPGIGNSVGPGAEAGPHPATYEGTGASYEGPTYGSSYEGTPSEGRDEGSEGPFEHADEGGRTGERGRVGTPARGTTVPRQIR
ncbi:cell division protein FtsK, partial [Streptomyces sp. T-3]|nr:cell division protein FtsK [Streptomyces sp. T-3]